MADEHRWVELSEGDEFAGYRIERRLGRGGMGVLYLAIEPGLERRVALKLIAPEAAADDVFARRFAEESKIAASIEHPNVVPIYAAGEEDGVPFIAMRYVSGSDLGRRLTREGRLVPAEAVGLIAQVGSGLDAIHAAGLVHRDVKPANVLLTGDEETDHAYITDFGVARNVATQSGLTQTGRFVGTLDYVAPEQISGGEIDARVDVYALGCLLFKLLTGEVPFPRDGEAARLYAHLNDPPPAPSLYVPEVSMALDDVVIRALSKQPGDRFPSAGDLGRAAVAALRGEQPSLPERTVATGAAATQTAATISPEASTPQDEEASAPGPPTATRRGGPAPAHKAPAAPQRRLAVAAGLLAVAAIVAAAIAFGGGGEEPSGGAVSAGDTQSAASRGAQNAGGGAAAVKDPQPEPLDKSELIARADAICGDSQDSYKEVRAEFPQGESTADASYSERLVDISTPAVKRFEALAPPPSVASAYEKYVRAQQRVHAYDVEALEAAKREDTTAYLRAREKRDEEQPERHALAQEIGFEVCSASPE